MGSVDYHNKLKKISAYEEITKQILKLFVFSDIRN